MKSIDKDLIYEALKFFVWAAGQGIMPNVEEPVGIPEDTLYEYSLQTDYKDWDNLPSKIMKGL